MAITWNVLTSCVVLTQMHTRITTTKISKHKAEIKKAVEFVECRCQATEKAQGGPHTSHSPGMGNPYKHILHRLSRAELDHRSML
jgi:hypothetical protein